MSYRVDAGRLATKLNSRYRRILGNKPTLTLLVDSNASEIKKLVWDKKGIRKRTSVLLGISKQCL